MCADELWRSDTQGVRATEMFDMDGKGFLDEQELQVSEAPESSVGALRMTPV